MEELDKLTYPKPNADFIYGTFDDFADKHPWVGRDYVHPKGVGREMYETAHDFKGFVIDYKLERSEGLVLRYMTDVYKALVQTVPSWARTPEVEDMIEYFGGVVRGVDASLIEEWEQLRDPSYVPTKVEESDQIEVSRGITSNKRAFTVLVRNALFRIVRALASKRYEAALAELEAPEGEAWAVDRLATTLEPFFAEHELIRTDPRARGTEHVRIEEHDDHWQVRQILLDPEEHNDWYFEVRVDLARSDEEDKPVLRLQQLAN
jgi:hypothetical protein